MSSDIYITNGRKLSNTVRNMLKLEKGISLGVYRRKGKYDSLYLIGERHAVPSNNPKNLPKFTLRISEGLLNILNDDAPLHLTGLPNDIKTVKDLRKQINPF